MHDFGEIALNATVKAAITCYDFIGKNKKNESDGAAVKAIREYLLATKENIRIVIGEGERDEAPMLFANEIFGDINKISIDVAVDPLEGTDLCAKNLPGAMSVIALGAPNSLLRAPDVYMSKFAISNFYPSNIISFENSLEQNLNNLADYKKCKLSDLKIITLNRERHHEMISFIRKNKIQLDLIQDGDIAAVISTSYGPNKYDAYIGIGGAPEGVLAASALHALGGFMLGKLLFRNELEKERAKTLGITDYDRIYDLHDLSSKDVLFCATGVTSGDLLRGVEKNEGRFSTNSLILDSRSGSIELKNQIWEY